jgi:hypothetical protein
LHTRRSNSQFLLAVKNGHLKKVIEAAALKAVHYDYVVSIEHKDRNYEGDEELVKRGFYLARDVLKPYIY